MSDFGSELQRLMTARRVGRAVHGLAATLAQAPALGTGDPAGRIAHALENPARGLAAAVGDWSAKDLIKEASDVLASARLQRERSWTRCLESPDLTHQRLTIAARLGDRPGVYRTVRDLMLQAADPEQKTGRMLATIGLSLTTIGDISEAVRFGWRALDAVQVSKATYAFGRLSELGAALAHDGSPGAAELREAIHVTRRELVSPRPSRPDSLPAQRRAAPR